MSRTSKIAQFHLIVEGGADGALAQRDVKELPSLAVADGPLELDVASLGDAPKLAAVQPDAAETSNALRFETLQAGDTLLMIAPRELAARINGLPAPRVAILNVADQVQAGDGTLHVTRFRSGWVGPPAPEHIGLLCPVCSVEIDAETRVVVHDCGAVLHAEEAGSKPDIDLLECSSLGSCPNCDKNVDMATGLVWTPEL